MSAIQSAFAAAERSIARGDADAAFAASDRMIRLGMCTPATFSARALALEMGAQHEAALDDLLEAAVASPGQSEFKLHSMRFAFRHGMKDRAAKLALLWLGIEPDLIRHPEFTEALRHIKPPFGYCELRGDVLAGWAVGSQSKNLVVEIDGVYAEAQATRPTPELAAMGIGDGCNGFSIRLPVWQRVVRVGIEGQSLWGTPFANPEMPAGAPPVKAPLPLSEIDIIVPVYKGKVETLACIHSVLSAPCKLASRLIVVDDCSPDRELAEALSTLEQQGRLALLRRKINAGFIGAVHTALDADPASVRDIVLLNADTLVHGDWLDRLQQVAYSHRTVATVTPLSNNAELLSHPEPHRQGAMPDEQTLAILDDLASSGRARPMPVPTGIGFCMYIRRDALRALGGFDEAFLKRGYAEENDFCLRARENGWRNVAAPNVYVAHHGEISFGLQKRWLAAYNVRRLKFRHPDHDADYDSFLARDPLARHRRTLQRKALRPLLRARGLTVVVTDVDDTAWRMGSSPEARLLMAKSGAVLEFRHIAGLGRIEYAGKRGLAECARDLQTARFSRVVLHAAGDEARRLASFAGYGIDGTAASSEDVNSLPLLSEGPRAMRLLVPTPSCVDDFRRLCGLAKEWLVNRCSYQLVVLGITFNDEHLAGMSNVQVIGPLERQQVDGQGARCLRPLIRQYGITAIGLLTARSARDWTAIGNENGLPVYRLPLPEAGLSAGINDVVTADAAGKAEKKFSGALTSLEGLCVSGWARNDGLPGVPVVVELLADGLPVSLAHADQYPASQNEQGNGVLPDRGQFRCFLRPDILRGISSLRARIANTDHFLLGELRPRDARTVHDKQGREMLRSTSFVRNHGGIRITGVAIDAARPQLTLVVHVEHKGQRIAQALANDWSADLHDIPGIDAAHGFSISLPIEFADGSKRIVRVFDDSGREIPGSPLTVCCVDKPVESWLNAMRLGREDSALLENVLHMARRHVPLSVGFSEYSEWKKRFGSTNVSETRGKVLVVLGFVSVGHEHLQATLASLKLQTHKDWIACVKGGGESDDARIRFVGDRQWKKAIRTALNESDYAAVIEPGDEWHPHTLAHALAALQSKGARIAYCDCDHSTSSQVPWFKPDWCPDVFLAQPLLHHGFVADAALLAKVVEGDAPADWPWLAAASVGDDAAAYAHVAHPHHTSGNVTRGPGKRARSLVEQRFNVRILPTRKPAPHSLIYTHEITYPEPQWPTVTLIVPTRDGIDLLKPCIDSLLRTDYPELDICVIDNGSTCPQTLDYLQQLPSRGVRVLSWPYPFNYSAINNFAVEQTRSEVIGLVNNDVEALDGSWLKAMVVQLMRDGVGAVGAKLLWKNRMVQHGGVQLGLYGHAGHIGNNWMDADAGYCGINQIERSASAVTAACLLIGRADYQRLGGLDEEAFPVAFNDVDLCLRLRASGKRVVWTPAARLIHVESAIRGSDKLRDKRARFEREIANLHSRWGELLFRDPAYNPNLNLDQYSHTALALPPRHL